MRCYSNQRLCEGLLQKTFVHGKIKILPLVVILSERLSYNGSENGTKFKFAKILVLQS